MSISNTILDSSDIERRLTRMTYEILEKHKKLDKLALIGSRPVEFIWLNGFNRSFLKLKTQKSQQVI